MTGLTASKETEGTKQAVCLPFSVTPEAASRIFNLLEGEDKPYFRVRVDSGGCSGFQYKFDFDAQKNDDDLTLIQHGVTVLIDDISMGFLTDAKLDYVEELVGSYFKVINPNTTASCGCGTSFSV